MSNSPNPNARASVFQRFWKWLAVAGAGGGALTVWLEEVWLFVQDLLAIIFLPILAGAVYLLDILFFKSRAPRREDLNHSTLGRK